MAEVAPSAQQQFSPGRYFLRINYQRQSRLHSHTVAVSDAIPGGGNPLAIPTSLDNWAFGVEGNPINTPVNGQIAVNALVDTLRQLLTPDASYIDATLFDQPTAGDTPLPVAGTEFTGKVGTGSAFANVDLRVMKTTMSFRTATFGRFKIVLIEGIYSSPTKLRGSAARLPEAVALIDYLLGQAGSWVVGADGSRPAAYLSYSVTEDNGLRKRYY